MYEILRRILDVTAEELNQIDFSFYKEHTAKLSNYPGYLYMPAGREHYRLLAYISSLFNNNLLIDVGTFQGFSALAMGYNKSNRVLSYDIARTKEVDLIIENKALAQNIEFRMNGISEDAGILRSPFIILDVDHGGRFEVAFINMLIGNKWHGLMLMDDIRIVPILTAIWNRMPLEKYDLTDKGHWSGTGLVVF